MNIDNLIEKERHGFWIAITFILALLALVLAFSAVWRLNVSLVGSHMEILALNGKIEALKSDQRKPAHATMPAPDAAPK